MVGEDATKERADNTGDSVAGTEKTSKGRRHLGRGRESDNGVAARCNAGAASTGDGAADNQGGAVGCGAADEGAELEDGDGQEEGEF